MFLKTRIKNILTYILKIGDFDRFFSRHMSRLGEFVSDWPGQFIFIPLLVTVILATGLQRYDYESNPEYLFVPVEAPSVQEKKILDEIFPQNNSRFVRGTETAIPQFLDVILMTPNRTNVFNREVLDEARNLDRALRLIKISIDGEEFMWKKLCVRFNGECIQNDYLYLDSVVQNDVLGLPYPIQIDPVTDKVYPIVAHVGGISKDPHRGQLVNFAEALKLTYILDFKNERTKRAVNMWSLTAQQVVYSAQLQHTQAHAATHQSIEIELCENIDSMSELIPYSVAYVVAFTIFNCMSTDWVRGKPIPALVGLAITIVSALSAFGLVMYAHYKWQAINIVVILLMIGIGLDDTFVMLSAWWRSEKQHKTTVKQRMSETYRDAAISITITTATSVISFAIGAIVPGFPCVQIFCVYAGVGLLFVYLYTITILGGVLALFGKLEEKNRHCLFFCKVLSREEVDARKLSFLYRALLQGGRSSENPSNARDNKTPKTVRFFRHVVTPFLSKGGVKACVVLIFFAYLAVSLYGISTLKEGLERQKLASDYSTLVPYFEIEDRYFRDHPYRLQFAIYEEIDYYNETVQNQVFALINELESSKFVSSNPDFRQSWFHHFMETSQRNFLSFDTTTRENFYNSLALFMEGATNTPISNDVKFNENKTAVIASKFYLQSERIANARDEVQMLRSLRNITNNAPFKVLVYHPFFGYLDQFSQVLSTTIECVVSCLGCMALITFIFIPNRACVIWVLFTVVSVELGVVGFMALLNINLDVISMIMLIMSIGFSVDFSAHISYHYLSAGEGTESGESLSPEERLRHSLESLGGPVVQGGMSTILAIWGIVTHPSYICTSFAKLILIIMVLGVVHGLLLLPVLLSIFGPGSTLSKKLCGKRVKESDDNYSASDSFIFSGSVSMMSERSGEKEDGTSSTSSKLPGHKTPDLKLEKYIQRVLREEKARRDKSDSQMDSTLAIKPKAKIQDDSEEPNLDPVPILGDGPVYDVDSFTPDRSRYVHNLDMSAKKFKLPLGGLRTPTSSKSVAKRRELDL